MDVWVVTSHYAYEGAAVIGAAASMEVGRRLAEADWKEQDRGEAKADWKVDGAGHSWDVTDVMWYEVHRHSVRT